MLEFLFERVPILRAPQQQICCLLAEFLVNLSVLLKSGCSFKCCLQKSAAKLRILIRAVPLCRKRRSSSPRLQAPWPICGARALRTPLHPPRHHSRPRLPPQQTLRWHACRAALLLRQPSATHQRQSLLRRPPRQLPSRALLPTTRAASAPPKAIPAPQAPPVAPPQCPSPPERA